MAVLLMQTTEAPAFPSISGDRRVHAFCPANSIQVRLSLVSVCWHFKSNSLFHFSTATRQKVGGSICGVKKAQDLECSRCIFQLQSVDAM